MPRINWRQAAGEALFILLGILLALAVDAWWEERSERRQEREYLEALHVELDQLQAHVDTVVRTADEIVQAGTVLLEVAPDWRSSVSPDSLSSLFRMLSNEVAWSPPTAVYQDLVNTGAVRVIRSDAVRLGLNELMKASAWVDSRQHRHNDYFWTEMEPYFRQHFPILAVWGGPPPDRNGPPGDSPVPRDAWTPGDFVQSEEFRNLVAAKMLTALDVLYAGRELTALIAELSATITVAAGAL